MDEPKSKSQKKREAEALQAFGIRLIKLSRQDLDRLPLDDRLKQALIEAKSLTSNGAVRRQAQLIGKLMRAAKADEIINAYQALRPHSS